MVGIVSSGHILGIEEAVNQSQNYKSTVVCVSQNAELYRIEREMFTGILKQTSTWSVLTQKSNDSNENNAKSIFKMQKSNLNILDRLKSTNLQEVELKVDDHPSSPNTHRSVNLEIASPISY